MCPAPGKLFYQDTRSAIHNFRDRFPKQIHSADKGEIFLDPPDDPFEKYGSEKKLFEGKYSRKEPYKTGMILNLSIVF